MVTIITIATVVIIMMIILMRCDSAPDLGYSAHCGYHRYLTKLYVGSYLCRIRMIGAVS